MAQPQSQDFNTQVTIVGALTIAGVTTMVGGDQADQQTTTSSGVTNTSPTSSSVPGVATTDRNIINICSLNVCGLNSKLSTGHLDDYVKLYDIFCVSESKMKNGVEIDEFTVFNLENKTQNYPLPGIHGLHVYIANHIANKCVQITENNLHCNLVIWIKIADSFILGALYLPYEGSDYNNGDIYDELALDIWNISDKYDRPLLLTVRKVKC